ncbi:MAG: sodium-dependent transporter [Pseudomonadota bacterium]
MTTQDQVRFSTRLGLLLSVLGIAIGTGNIWRFPRIAAQNAGDDGAGAFLVAWLAFLFIWSIPLIIAEYALGRAGRLGVAGTFGRLAGRGLTWMGAFVGFVAMAIMFYYSVVAGWCLYYTVAMIGTPLPLERAGAEAIWNGFHSNGLPLAGHAIAMGLGALAVAGGVRTIERVNRILIPALLIIIVLALGRTLTLPGAFDGIGFLFTPDWATLAEPRIWLEALTQNAWDTGAGWGLILTYGAYMQTRHGIVKNAVLTGVGNNLVSLAAAVVIFGTVFAVLGSEMSKPEILGIMQTSGPAATGLTFIWMPQLFARMAGGELFAIVFFLALSFAAFSSLIAMIELSVRTLTDMQIDRRRAALIVVIVGFIAGIPSAINLGFFANQDFVWGVALMISGAFVAIAVMRQGVTRFRGSKVNVADDDWHIGSYWDLAIRWAIPALAVVLLGWWLYQAAAVYAPDRWYDPFDPFSLATCLVQWGIVLIVLIALNRRIADAHRL